ncbi:MAG: hypothetical protein AAGC56_11565, partial [Pseudomonadota bacterium]
KVQIEIAPNEPEVIETNFANLAKNKRAFDNNFFKELRSSFQGDQQECVDIYVLEAFDEPTRSGGGRELSNRELGLVKNGVVHPGTPDSFVLLSDQAVTAFPDGEANNTRLLAHEIGHVLGLAHPGNNKASPERRAQEGTLMCPTGVRENNPRFNSRTNERLVRGLSTELAESEFQVDVNPDVCVKGRCGPCPEVDGETDD